MNYLPAAMALGALTMSLAGSVQAQPAAPATSASPTATPSSAAAIERGRYLIKIGGCNDCHTTGYAQSGGHVPEKEWLQGDSVGWQGPWGTTYPINLRQYFHALSEQQWLHQARTLQARPPMPWFTLRDMSDADLRAVYAYMRHAGPAGRPAPAYVPPGQPVAGPVIRFPG